MSRDGNVIDAALRFARSNPELLAYAQAAAARTGRSVDDLLQDAIERVRIGADPQPRRYRSSSVASSRRTETSA